MTLGEHFREFRRRIVIAAIAIALGGAVGWFVYGRVMRWLQQPLLAVAAERHVSVDEVALNFGANGVTDAFGIKLKIALWIGLILASPVWLWQIWRFLAPGLTKREKRIGRGFIAAAVPLFALGCYVSTFALPNAVKFLLGITPAGAVNYTNAEAYVSFTTKFILAFGIAFLLPVFLVGLNTVHVFPGRIMLKGWRVAVMVIFVFAAMMSPSPDAWSMLALALPMVALYFAAVGISLFMDHRRAVRDRPAWADVPDDERSAL
ncbi:twin-arginine translocase subunit TatC [Leekyejoonella antrihumi]|uniref:Sec-independent protein translocase protein TatC n=2 Tax=Leekyejoonella antrihumi TaxID=1660198 RepID=A0A563E3S0_9MICO|nr:twin-arginine translocase subunit TatC [Leekyejoonella antrihumi]